MASSSPATRSKQQPQTKPAEVPVKSTHPAPPPVVAPKPAPIPPQLLYSLVIGKFTQARHYKPDYVWMYLKHFLEYLKLTELLRLKAGDSTRVALLVPLLLTNTGNGDKSYASLTMTNTAPVLLDNILLSTTFAYCRAYNLSDYARFYAEDRKLHKLLATKEGDETLLKSWKNEVVRLVLIITPWFRGKMIESVAKSYSTIPLARLCELVGADEKYMIDYAKHSGWIYHEDSKMVDIVNRPRSVEKQTKAWEWEQIAKMTRRLNA